MDKVIRIDADVMHGEPCFAGTRVAVQTLFDWLEEGHDIAYFIQQFPSVKHDQVIAVLEAARRHTLDEALAGQ
jgi:uncharacterized protein (DUF433 family)